MVGVREGGTAGFAQVTAGMGAHWAAFGGVGDEVGGFALAACPDVGHVEGVENNCDDGVVLG